ncbi:MAG: M50 family metallopeptidase [Acidobacteria bacterium]|nr:M50 family metallopeptidase [Acidobacteriota bacterium]
MSATPILDLEILPPELRTSKLPLIICGIIGIFLGVSPLLPPSWHTFSGLWLIPALYVAVAVHELGHLVAGKSVGMNVGGVVIGGFRIFKSGKRWTCQFDWRQAMAGGLAKPLPPTSDVSLAQFAWMIAGGPLASILLTLATGAITLRYGGGAGGWRDYLFWVALLTISSLIPGSAGPNRSDGAQLWMPLRRPEQCRSWIALLKIQTEEAEGVLPADWDASLVAEMLTAEPMSAEYSYCQLLTYYRRADQGDDLEAVQRVL